MIKISTLPGLLFVAVIAALAIFLQGFMPSWFNDVVIAIVIGAIIKNTVGVAKPLTEGIGFSTKKILKLAIILIGIRLSFGAVIKTGASALIIILICVTAAMLLTYFIGKKLGLSDKLATLIGIGTAICGATAIVATSPVVNADDQDTSLSVATIFIFNVIAMFLYPVIAAFIGLSDAAFGTWAGTAIHDTSSVVAAGFAYSDAAGETATIVKLTRTVMLVPLVFILGIIWARKESSDSSKKVSPLSTFPWFVLGFIAMAILNTLGIFSPAVVGNVNIVSKFLILMVMAGVGLGLDFKKMKKVGFNFLVAGLSSSVIMALLSLGLIKLFHVV